MVVKMTVDFESLVINEDVKKELREKIDMMEKEKNERIEEFQTKKHEIKTRIKKKDELVNQVNTIKLYMAKY